MFFHVLKNGCRIEALQLGSIEKIERALVLYMIPLCQTCCRIQFFDS